MFVASFVACLLDKHCSRHEPCPTYSMILYIKHLAISGTSEERGVAQWKKMINPEEEEHQGRYKSYDLPIGMKSFQK